MVILLAGSFRLLDPAREAGAREAMARMVAASRTEDGCLAYSFAEDVLEPGLIHVFELWRDQAALDMHRAAPHFRAFRESWAELGIGGRDMRMAEIEMPRPY